MSRIARGLFVAVAAFAFFLSASAVAQDRIVKNDSLGEQQEGEIASAELVAGEGYYVTLEIPQSISLPVELLGLRVLMVDSQNSSLRYCGRFQVEIFNESNDPFAIPSDCPLFNAKDPANVIYSMSQQFGSGGVGFEIEGNSNNLQDLRFSQINNNSSLNATINPVMIEQRKIRVGIKAVDTQCTTPGDEFPIIVSDLDGTQGDNFIYGQTSFCGSAGSEYWRWRDFASVLTTTSPSDFVIRAILEGTGGGGDVIVDAGTDTATADTSDTASDTGSDTGAADDTGSADDGGDEDGGSDDTGASVDTGGDDTGTTEEDASAGDFAVASVSPSKVPSTVSTGIVIVGSGFQPGAQVRINATAIGVVEVQSGLIEATVPEGFEVGTYDLIVSNPNGETASLPQGLDVYDPNAEGGDDAGGGQGFDEGSSGVEGGCGCASSGTGSVPAGSLALLLVGLIAIRVRRWIG